MHGPTCVFWANLTPFSLQIERLLLEDAPESLAWTFGATPFLHACSTGQVQCAEVLVAAGCDTAATMANGFTGRARSHRRFVLSFIHFIP